MSQQTDIRTISLDGNNKPISVIINGIPFETGTFMDIDDEVYYINRIMKEPFRFGGRIKVVLRINLEDKNKNIKTLFFTEDTYWLQGNDMSPKSISELKYEVIVDMTDEEFYLKPATPVTTTPYDPTRYCSGGRDMWI
jgi:hypothetical protein